MDVLVEASWVAERIGSGEIVVLDATLPPVGVVPRVDTHARYLDRHLPGALFFDIDALSDTRTTLPHMLPPPERFAREMRALGVPSQGRTIVIYEQAGVFSAPRAWWMLRVMGAEDVRVLNGDLAAWQATGLPTEQGPVALSPAVFQARPQPGAVADWSELQTVLAEGGQVLDARSAGRFAGTAPEPRAGLESGHMPGAVNLPYTDLVRDGKLKPAAEMATVLQARGVDVTKPVVTTCGSGVTAAVLTLALQMCGSTHARLYDGSWAEYASRPGATIVKS